MGWTDADEARFAVARAAAEEARRRFEDHDPYTCRHSIRVADWAVLIAGHVPGFARSRLRVLEITALLHDYGKTFIDPAVIRKGDRLTDEEWAAVRTHPDLGADRVPVAREFVSPDGIRWHHKHFDGSGYPPGDMKGPDIPLEARLIAVADVFDALTSPREYRGDPREYAPADALELMREMAGAELDPGLVALFQSVYDIECSRHGGKVGASTLQVRSVIGTEVARARDLLRAEIGPFDPRDPLKGRRPEPRLVDRLVTGLVRANLDRASATNIVRYVLRLPLDETFPPSDLAGAPRRGTTPPGGFLHHVEVCLDLRRLPPEAAYAHVVVFMGQLWLAVGERREGGFEVRLAR
ncbi:MAG: HD domain-containing protein [Deltaproteobacteria bacterium]|nr:HD domain-containing protein [Deltaproteobacteria bacterium]